MKSCRCIQFFALILMVLMNGCKEVYIPPSVPLNSSYLVVDGILFAGNDSSTIRLSRSRNLVDSTPVVYELNARVSVVNAAGVEYLFNEKGNGQYIIDKLNLDSTQNYKLKIITTDGNIYFSDSVPVRTTPPIDSLSWIRDDAGVHVTLNAHDPANNTRYYKWEYLETWEYQTFYQSALEYIGNGQAAFRTPADQIYTCYLNNYSTDINVASTNNLSQDLVNRQPITTVLTGSEKITNEYCLQVNQYALTQDAYTFWQNLKANSQNLGSLFDMQPYTQLGNLHCVSNPAIPVIGYVSICTLQQTRIFINKNDVLPWNYAPYYGNYCTLMGTTDLTTIFPGDPPYFYTIIGTNTSTYLYSILLCGDCRDHGGTTIKPAYMP